MAFNTASGSKIFIGPVRTGINTISDYEEISTWIEVGEVETLGEFGDESAEVTFQAIGDARVRKAKGGRNAGTLALTVGRDPLDPGQIALLAAEKTSFEYAFKVIASDAIDEDHTDSVFYFGAPVMSARHNYGTGDNVVRTTFNLGINTDILEVPSEEIDD